MLDLHSGFSSTPTDRVACQRPSQAFWRSETDASTASFNERQVLEGVRRTGQMSRADLVRVTGLTAQSVMRLVDELCARGLVRLGNTLPREGRGKPSPAVELVSSYAYTVGFSVTTDSISSALLDFSGAVVAQKQSLTNKLTKSDFLELIRQHVQAYQQVHHITDSQLLGVGVGITGFFVGEDRQVNPPDPLDDLALADLDVLLSQSLGLPVWPDNDGTVAAVGESMLGVGCWAKNFVYLYFAYGLGGGVVVNGQCVRGAHGNGGEVAGMLAMQGLAVPTLEQLRCMLADDGLVFADISAMLTQFNIHWAACDRWVTLSRPAMLLMVSSAFALLDPDAIVYGGRLPRALAERLIASTVVDNKPRRGRKRPEPRLVPAEGPRDTTAIGAALLPLRANYFG